ncbi:MAG: hypothetical protein PHW04_15610 [Candidatus Wallbacteria bacterium]|nr:hypothetical protein [Candidatus Wallbacteria bacterium]
MKNIIMAAFLSTVSMLYAADLARNYEKALLWLDDFRGKPEELALIEEFKPDMLLRSWYRWGQPDKDKLYEKRTQEVRALRKNGMALGGGGSLSIVNEQDLKSPDFDMTWLSTGLDGKVIAKDGQSYGSLSAPGFREYLIRKAMEQARLGAVELHFGETNGRIDYDDWTLGLKGDNGFIQWLRKKYADKTSNWWKEYLGDFGDKVFRNSRIVRSDFLKMSKAYSETFKSEWGKSGSWKGLNAAGKPAFLAYIYRENLDSFIGSLRKQLLDRARTEVSIDIWGFADWILELKNKPDAYIECIPNKDWGLDWFKKGFPTGDDDKQLRKIMTELIKSVYGTPVVFTIDHPHPFEEYRKLPDQKRADLTRYFANLTWSLNAKFLFRSYSQEQKDLGPLTRQAIRELCDKAKKSQIQ